MTQLSRTEVVEKFRSIRLLALDVDGVLTDDSIWFGPGGFEMKRFNISDGLFMVLAMRAGLAMAVVSGRYSEATVTRMKDLGVKHVLQGSSNKVNMIEPLLKELKLTFKEVAFIGNEILDISLAERVGLPIAVADSAPELLEVAAFTTTRKGGEGAIREVLECYFESIGKDPKSFLS
jgi:3-deoxy-D-manno-octulosonate 8-phosphate phosphatase (KDO 8-P phosphatase)